jgi:prepilin-type N-terminal cleavage/methylation domain-containing protein
MQIGRTSPERRRADSAKRGFTLVEVIVVLVILAILAAIAIPALTGYIEKAEEKQWISKARNIAMAWRAAITEDYGAGKFGPSGAFALGFTDGGALDTKIFINSELNTEAVGHAEDNAHFSLTKRAVDLLAAEHMTDEWTQAGYWFVYLYADGDSDVNALGADAFSVSIWPDGMVLPTGTEYRFITVTYKLTHSDYLANGTNGGLPFGAYYDVQELHYDANAGYEVYSNTFIHD